MGIQRKTLFFFALNSYVKFATKSVKKLFIAKEIGKIFNDLVIY